MIIYSVTVSIDKKIEEEWLGWMKTKHIPDVMNTEYFLEYQICRLIDPVTDVNMGTYNIQYLCHSLTDYETYNSNAAAGLQKEHTDRYKDRFVAFRTILEKLT